MLEDCWVEVRCVVVRFFWWLLPMPETGGNLKEKRQLWHFKERRQKRWHLKGLPKKERKAVPKLYPFRRGHGCGCGEE